jgi:hypothetical protein
LALADTKAGNKSSSRAAGESMSPATTLDNLAISETGFVFDPRSGTTYTLNPTAQAIVVALRAGLPLDGIVAHLSRSFESVADQVGEDVLDFVRDLRQNGLLPPDFNL